MCFYCPADLATEDGEATIRIIRIADTGVAPSDVTQDPAVLLSFDAGERFLMALQATLYIRNHPVATEVLHGIVESDYPGELSCAFEDDRAVKCLLSEVKRSAYATGHLRHGNWVLH